MFCMFPSGVAIGGAALLILILVGVLCLCRSSSPPDSSPQHASPAPSSSAQYSRANAKETGGSKSYDSEERAVVATAPDGLSEYGI